MPMGHCFHCSVQFYTDDDCERLCQACQPALTWFESAEPLPTYTGGGAGSLTSPFRVLVDTREQLAYGFHQIKADAVANFATIKVAMSPCTLAAGDYSIDGYADRVAVERKSYADLAGTLTRGRQRFIREIEKLAAMPVAWVVTEANLTTMRKVPPPHSAVLPKTLWRSIMALQVRFPNVQWWLCDGREEAEGVTYRLLEKWWQEWVDKPAKAAKKLLKAGR